MKKTICSTVLTLTFCVGYAHAQDPTPATAQAQVPQARGQMTRKAAAENSRTLTWERGHRDYFPGTDVDGRPDGKLPDAQPTQRGRRNSGTSSIGDGVNQCDVDYGNRLDAWRRQVVALTVQNTFFWVVVFESVPLLVLCAYLIYLDREKRQRHIIAADIVCQLYNAWAYSDRKARTVIAKHNYWIRQLNEDYEGSTREVRGELSSGPAPVFEDVPVQSSIVSPEAQIIDEGTPSYPIISADVMVSGPRAVQEESFANADPVTKGASIPTLDSARYQMSEGGSPLEVLTPVKVDDALARANRSAAATAADSEWQREKRRLEEKVRAGEEQNRALRKMLNNRNEAVDQESPFEQEGRA